MSIASLTQLDRRIREAVQLQLEWDAEVEATGIGVAAVDHVVTLTGFIDTYAGKLAAERAARRVRGVKAVANDIQVRLRLRALTPTWRPTPFGSSTCTEHCRTACRWWCTTATLR